MIKNVSLSVQREFRREGNSAPWSGEGVTRMGEKVRRGMIIYLP